MDSKHQEHISFFQKQLWKKPVTVTENWRSNGINNTNLNLNNFPNVAPDSNPKNQYSKTTFHTIVSIIWNILVYQPSSTQMKCDQTIIVSLWD